MLVSDIRGPTRASHLAPIVLWSFSKHFWAGFDVSKVALTVAFECWLIFQAWFQAGWFFHLIRACPCLSNAGSILQSPTIAQLWTPSSQVDHSCQLVSHCLSLIADSPASSAGWTVRFGWCSFLRAHFASSSCSFQLAFPVICLSLLAPSLLFGTPCFVFWCEHRLVGLPFLAS